MKAYFFLQFFMLCNGLLVAQEQKNYSNHEFSVTKIAFYNVENLFDTWDDPHCNDEEFLPWGIKNWNKEKLYNKLLKTARVIMGMGSWEMPALIGLCEIENRYVLDQLLLHTPLSSWPYSIIHFESPDHRGIDVALLYQASVFDVLYTEAIPVILTMDISLKTRDILYVKGVLCQLDTLHIFVNHWPSRYGDYTYTSLKRLRTAETLLRKLDSINYFTNGSKIVVMGDFNDEPWDESLKLLDRSDFHLINLMKEMKQEGQEGTIKYKSQWYFFDQILVSSNISSRCEAFIYRPHFLIMRDDRYLGNKPFRTYSGPGYIGGYSDHLPVFMKLKVKD